MKNFLIAKVIPIFLALLGVFLIFIWLRNDVATEFTLRLPGEDGSQNASIEIEPISTGYMLIESGRISAVEFMSNTKPIPADKPEIAKAHALAAEYMGMKLIYLEAGSGAEYPVSDSYISEIRKFMTLPIIVGGGIKEPEIAKRKVDAGASIVVVGNLFEKHGRNNLIKEFSDAIHYKKI